MQKFIENAAHTVVQLRTFLKIVNTCSTRTRKLRNFWSTIPVQLARTLQGYFSSKVQYTRTLICHLNVRHNFQIYRHSDCISWTLIFHTQTFHLTGIFNTFEVCRESCVNLSFIMHHLKHVYAQSVVEYSKLVDWKFIVSSSNMCELPFHTAGCAQGDQ